MLLIFTVIFHYFLWLRLFICTWYSWLKNRTRITMFLFRVRKRLIMYAWKTIQCGKPLNQLELRSRKQRINQKIPLLIKNSKLSCEWIKYLGIVAKSPPDTDLSNKLCSPNFARFPASSGSFSRRELFSSLPI